MSVFDACVCEPDYPECPQFVDQSCGELPSDGKDDEHHGVGQHCS